MYSKPLWWHCSSAVRVASFLATPLPSGGCNYWGKRHSCLRLWYHYSHWLLY
jgi:hypothetical protein